MTTVDQVFGQGWADRLATEVNEGWVRKQKHPDAPLFIFNYTEKAVYERHWNDVTMVTRGLILDHEGTLIARPFPKFYNHGEQGAAVPELDDDVFVYDKMDGSLGIMYWGPDGPAIATRGSFASDQAVHATEVLRSRYLDWANSFFHDHLGFPFTALFEIIYPENRIVVDYGDQDDLVLLGAQTNRDGEHLAPSVLGFPGPTVDNLGCMTYREALELPDRQGKEGVVIYNPDTEERVKIKQEDYMRLHKIVTNLNERAVWEIMKDRTRDTWAWIAELPDEFHEWAKRVAHDIRDQLTVIYHEIDQDFTEILGQLHGDSKSREYRKAFAELAVKTEYPWAMFAMLDNRRYDDKVWDLVKPAAAKGPCGSASGSVG